MFKLSLKQKIKKNKAINKMIWIQKEKRILFTDNMMIISVETYT